MDVAASCFFVFVIVLFCLFCVCLFGLESQAGGPKWFRRVRTQSGRIGNIGAIVRSVPDNNGCGIRVYANGIKDQDVNSSGDPSSTYFSFPHDKAQIVIVVLVRSNCYGEMPRHIGIGFSYAGWFRM